MQELFIDTSNWDNVATSKWSVSGGESIGLGAIIGGEAKIMVFTHNELNRSKGFLMVSASIGAKLEAKVPKTGVMGLASGGFVDKVLNYGGHAKQVSDGAGVNPLNFSPPAEVNVKTPFSIKDLEFANGVSVSVGATGGIVDTGVAGFSFYHRNGRHLFTMSEVTVQAAIGAGINMGTLQGSRLINLAPSQLSAAEQAAIQQQKKSIPWEHSPSRRPAGGW